MPKVKSVVVVSIVKNVGNAKLIVINYFLNPLKFWKCDYEVVKSHFSNFGRLLVEIGGMVATGKKM